MSSKVSEKRPANRIKKNNHDTLKTIGQSSFIKPALRVESLENHKLKSARLYIKKIAIGRRTIESRITNLLSIRPLISFGTISTPTLKFFNKN